MFPTLQDLDVQNQINHEHILKVALRRQMKSQTRGSRKIMAAKVVRFGAWLERVGCRLQSRFSPPASLEMGSTTMNDAHLQSC